MQEASQKTTTSKRLQIRHRRTCHCRRCCHCRPSCRSTTTPDYAQEVESAPARRRRNHRRRPRSLLPQWHATQRQLHGQQRANETPSSSVPGASLPAHSISVQFLPLALSSLNDPIHLHALDYSSVPNARACCISPIDASDRAIDARLCEGTIFKIVSRSGIASSS